MKILNESMMQISQSINHVQNNNNNNNVAKPQNQVTPRALSPQELSSQELSTALASNGTALNIHGDTVALSTRVLDVSEMQYIVNAPVPGVPQPELNQSPEQQVNNSSAVPVLDVSEMQQVVNAPVPGVQQPELNQSIEEQVNKSVVL
jgi:acetyl/propionyl-CoA carboxylase alpha subunit